MFRSDERETIREAALSQWGRERSNTIIGLLLLWRALPWLAGVAAIAAIGYGAYRAWTAITDSLPETDSPGQVIATVPGLAWLSLIAVAVGVVWVIAPGRLLRPGVRAIRVIAFTITLAALIGIMLGTR